MNREVENLNPMINPAYIVVNFVVMLCFVVICSAAKDSIDKPFASSVGVFSGVCTGVLLVASNIADRVINFISWRNIQGNIAEFSQRYGANNNELFALHNYSEISRSTANSLLCYLFIASYVLLITACAMIWYRNKYVKNADE